MARKKFQRTDRPKGAGQRQEAGKADPHFSDKSGGGGETDWHHAHDPELNRRHKKA